MRLRLPSLSGMRVGWILVVAMLSMVGCSNSPYPGEGEESGTIHYRAFITPPKDFDPQRAYTTTDNQFLSLCYERLLRYDYLKRPVELVPDLAVAVPESEEMRDEEGELTGIRYRFELQPGVMFIDDACFPEGKGRELKAEDFVFVLKRIADPRTNCPVAGSFGHIKGFDAFRKRVGQLREEREDGSVVELYRDAGELEGVRATGDYTLEITLNAPYPQILYWFAMGFVSAIPWEAVEFYDGRNGSNLGSEPLEFGQRPVGTGAYRFKWDEYNRDSRIVMVRNENWWGTKYPDRVTPMTRYAAKPPSASDVEMGAWREERAGSPLASIDRVEWYLEREALSYFNKFLQGYYDSSSVPSEMFDQVIQADQLTPEMKERGIRLVKDFGMDVFYIGFNMDDDTVGAPVTFKDATLEANRDKELERRRKLRQAMSLAIDSEEYMRIFANRLGVTAQSPIPPGVFGYDAGYTNKFRVYDPALTRAKELMVEAGYANGIDASTGEPLRLTFDAGSTDTRSRAVYNFYIDAWKRLGINVELDATDYNKFQQKMHAGTYQVFSWGWVADYPDAENFLFLLYGPNSSKYGDHNPNSSRFENTRYDSLFKRMETLSNEDSATWTDSETGQEVSRTRGEIIKEMVQLVEEECPWIPVNHRETYFLFHQWLLDVKPYPMSDSMTRYYTVEREERSVLREVWNRPIRWPVVVVVAGVLLFLIPGIITIRRERR